MANRRRLLEPSGLALAGGIAGCSADAPESTPEGTATDTETGTTETGTTTRGGGDGTSGTLGGDELGSAEDLQSAATVEGLVLDEDRGAGRNVFSPAVVWIEPGATVTWEFEGADTRRRRTTPTTATGRSGFPRG